jgi:predicted acetyltransferase
MSFYRKFGFGSCEAVDILRVAPSHIPDSPHRLAVRSYDASKDFSELARVYDEARARNVRGVGALKRDAYWWQKRVLRNNPDVVVFQANGKPISGYAIYGVPSQPAFPSQECRVQELIATDADAYRGLLGFFRALGEQYRVVDLPLPRSQSRSFVLDHGSLSSDPLQRESIGFLHTENMARLIDVPKALALHPLPTRRSVRGDVGLDVHDPLENKSNSFDVTFDANAIAKLGSASKERLQLGTDRLAQIYFGAARATDLLANGFITGSIHAAEKTDDAFFGLELFGGPLNSF